MLPGRGDEVASLPVSVTLHISLHTPLSISIVRVQSEGEIKVPKILKVKVKIFLPTQQQFFQSFNSISVVRVKDMRRSRTGDRSF